MKAEKIYERVIHHPLTAARRKAVGKYIEENAHLAPKPVAYHWDDPAAGVLYLEVDPVVAELRFENKKVELHAAAPFWARLLFTEKRKSELKEQVETMLLKTGFVTAAKAS